MTTNLKFDDFNNWKNDDFSFYDYIYQVMRSKEVSTDIFFASTQIARK